MSIAEKLMQIAENEQRLYDAGYAAGQNAGYDEGYEAGRQAELNALWNTIQHPTRKVWQTYFAYSDDWIDLFYPIRDIVVVNGAQMFERFAYQSDRLFNLSQRLKDCGVSLDTSGMTGCNNMFYLAQITNIPTIDFRKCTKIVGTFGSSYIEEIEKIIVYDGLQYQTIFGGATNLRDIRVEGAICNDIDFSPCTKLTRNSIDSIMEAALTGGRNDPTRDFTVTLSLAAVNKAFETSEGANDGSTNGEDWLWMMSQDYRYHQTVLL